MIQETNLTTDGEGLSIEAVIVGVHPHFLDIGTGPYIEKIVGAWEIELAPVRVVGSVEEAQAHLRTGTRFRLVPIEEETP